MLKSIKKVQSGFTIIELLIVIAIIAILALLTINNYVGVQAKGRDTTRLSDINDIKDELEEYFNDNIGYPNTFSASTFPGIDGESLKDPKGQSVSINGIVTDETTALAVQPPTISSTSQYLYIPFGTSSCTNNCTGYVLKTYIEKPSTTIANPYIRKGANNP